MVENNPHIGSSLHEFLKEDGLYDEVNAVAIKRSIALQIEREMRLQKITKSEMARRMKTSASQLSRLLDPENDKVQLDTLFKAASAVGRSLSVELT